MESQNKEKILIQGGAFRLDKELTGVERYSFFKAVQIYCEYKEIGKETVLAIIVNDLGVPHDKRPKVTGKLEWPAEYLIILKEAGISKDGIAIYYESSLRNMARKNTDKSQLKINENLGIPVPICRTIMATFYRKIAEEGFTRQIGFYSMDEKPKPCKGEKADKACTYGPFDGALEGIRNFALDLKITNHGVYQERRSEKLLEVDGRNRR